LDTERLGSLLVDRALLSKRSMTAQAVFIKALRLKRGVRGEGIPTHSAAAERRGKGLDSRLFSVGTPTNQQTAAPRPPASPDLSPVTRIWESSYCRGVQKRHKNFLEKVHVKNILQQNGGGKNTLFLDFPPAVFAIAFLAFLCMTSSKTKNTTEMFPEIAQTKRLQKNSKKRQAGRQAGR
jgi:hypothetical protein